ncbi:hypothetical protein NUV25_18260 [Burkholderia pseudomultivorans]|uniref:hypothetical protein n=1 Tax=Burkholderia pseudomultivorans TaxID=1207504 RepID=UPI00287439B9|nr:hypothetical protein [Burkholderia pseudomultivorans]MDS0859652.1 hypothetical protein [Burkholderia pseudomultivorans]
MFTDNRPLRQLVDKWLVITPPVRGHVIEFGRITRKGWRFVRIGATRSDALFSIVFFRHDDGSWNVFPPS